MAFSIIQGIYDGSGDPVPVSFTNGFLSRDHVTCRVNEEVDGLGDPVYRPLTWITDGLVQIGGTPLVNGDVYLLVRTTPRDELIHDYADGAPVSEGNLDESNLQALMLAQEILDGRFVEGFQQELNMNSRKIINLADGEDANDAVNRSQLEDFTGNAPFYAAQAAASASAAADTLSDTEDVYDATVILHDEVQTGLDELNGRFDDLPLNNYSAIAAPTVTDDSSAGYGVGSKWYDTVGKEAYACLDATVGAAIWETSTLTIDELGALAVQDYLELSRVDVALRRAIAHPKIQGLTLSNNATDAEHDLDFAAGGCWDDTRTVYMYSASAVTGAQLDALFGSGSGIMADAGGGTPEALTANCTVHLWQIMKADGTVAKFANVHEVSGLAPTLPTDYVYKRRLGSRVCDASGNLRPATSYGNRTELDEPYEVYNASVGTTPALAPVGVPNGMPFLAHMNARIDRASATSLAQIYTPGKTLNVSNQKLAISANGATASAIGAEANVITDDSAQVEVMGAGATVSMNIDIEGWTDLAREQF